MAFHDFCSTHDMICWKRRFLVGLIRIRGLVAGWLASQCGFVYSQRHGFKKLAVRGNFRAPRKKNDVTHNNVLFGYCCGRTIADYHDGFIIINPVEK